jgi:hypothetical protein
MAEAKAYTGGCHCGKVRYRVTTDLDRVIRCNCSICSKKGYWLSFVPASDFELESGADALTDYQFNKLNIHHLFCSTCGIQSFGRGTGPDGSEMVAVNVRCLDDVDLSKLAPTEFDGRSL